MAAFATDSGSSPSIETSSWLDRFFAHYYQCQPVSATFIGEHRWDAFLPDYSEAGVDGARARTASLLDESSSFRLDALTEDEGHDIRLAQGALRIQGWELSGRHFHRANPSLHTGEAVFGLISIFLTEYAPFEDRLAAAQERVSAIPQFLERARRTLGRSPRVWTERAIRECAGARALLEEGVPLIEGGRALQSASFAAAVERARAAFSKFSLFLESDLLARPTDEVAAGEEAFALLMREGHCLGENAGEIERYARAELAEVSAFLREQAGDFGAGSPAEAMAQLKAYRPAAEAYGGRYQQVWDDARRFALNHELVTWPDFPIRYVERPAWLRAAAPYLYFLFYRSPATLNRPVVHDYLISPLDRQQGAGEQRDFLEAHNDSVIKSNHVVHHGGIGHHVQNYHAFRSGSRIGRMAAVDGPSRIALMCGGTMAEGWACYATDLMAAAGFLTPLECYAERLGRARMCARAIVDVKIHTGGWSLDRGARFYEEHALMPAAAALSEAVKNSMFPGTATMYLTGRDAIHRLRSEIHAIEGHEFSLKRFHDTLLSYGSIPVSLIATSMKARASRRHS